MKFMIYFGLFVFLFMMSCFNLSVKLSYASDNIGVPIYIVNGGNFLQIVSGEMRLKLIKLINNFLYMMNCKIMLGTN